MSRDAAIVALGLQANFSKAELKRAFVAKAKEVHPDVNPSPQATKLFADLNEAFQVLEAEIDFQVPKTTSEAPKTKDEKLEEELERDFAAFRSWTEKRKRDKELDLKNRQQSIMWLLASAAAVLILGQVMQQVFGAWPWDSGLRKVWGDKYDELLKEYRKETPLR